jgi:hypothetical protein
VYQETMYPLLPLKKTYWIFTLETYLLNFILIKLQ